MTTTRPALSALALTGVALNASAEPPVQTDYDAAVFTLHNSGSLLGGELSAGVSNTLSETEFGQYNSGLDFAPDGTLYTLGNTSTIRNFCVGRVNQANGTVETVIDFTQILMDIPGVFAIAGLAVADDETLYAHIWTLNPATPDAYGFMHYTLDGTFLRTIQPTDASGATLEWRSFALDERADGMILIADAYSGAPNGYNSGRIGVMDPDTGLVEVIGSFKPHSNYCRAMSIIGDTAFLALGEQGNELYALDPYSGDMEFVMILPDDADTSGVWGMALAADPCAADMTYDNTLNTGDIETFVNMFLDGSTAADLDYSRTNNFDDLDVFVDSYLRGCDD